MLKQKVNLSTFIANQRQKNGNISQVELAKKCGVPAGTIASIESGYAKSPRPVTLMKIAEGLIVPPEIIFKLASNPEQEMFVSFDDLNVSHMTYLGTIPAEKTLDLDQTDEKLPFPLDFITEGEYVLAITGSSLVDEDIYDGDYVVIIRQNFLKRSGDLMLCKIEDTTTLKRIFKKENSYQIDGENYSKGNVEILGKAVNSLNKRKL